MSSRGPPAVICKSKVQAFIIAGRSEWTCKWLRTMYLFSRCRYLSHCAGPGGAEELITGNHEARRHSSSLLLHAAKGSVSGKERQQAGVRTQATGFAYCNEHEQTAGWQSMWLQKPHVVIILLGGIGLCSPQLWTLG